MQLAITQHGIHRFDEHIRDKVVHNRRNRFKAASGIADCASAASWAIEHAL